MWSLALAGLLAASGTVVAQAPESTATRPLERGARMGRRGGGENRGPGRAIGGREAALAGKVRQAFRGVVRRELNLNDDQAKQLETVDGRFQRQRDDISRDERAARIELAGMLRDTTHTPDATKVDQYLDRLVQAQHRRADLLESEQKALSEFLDPVQRAKYLALREQLQRRVQQMRQDGRGRGRSSHP
jgi:Spy/CpxP family protein refolding chaperone